MPPVNGLFTIPGSVLELIDLLNHAGFDCYVVGGYLRDLILQRPTHDYDLASSATPQDLERVFSSYRLIPTGLVHGTMTVIAGEDAVEVTTFRKEGSYSDFRHPDQVWFTGSIEDDLARRDFTINAMAWHPRKGLIDPWGGAADLDKRLIRAVGKPGKRFEEDALRILRAIRFRSELGFEIEAATRRALDKAGPLLRHIAPERIRIEMERILQGSNLAAVLTDHAGVLAAAIPPLEFLQQSRTDEGESLYQIAVKRTVALPPHPLKRMAALFYDMEEIACGDSAASIARDLRFSKEDREKIKLLADAGSVEMVPDQRAVWLLLQEWGEAAFFDVMELRKADARARYADHPDKLATLEAVSRLAEELIAEGRNLSLADLAIDGSDLLALGYRGPAIGETLERLLERVCLGGLANRKDGLLKELEQPSAETEG